MGVRGHRIVKEALQAPRWWILARGGGFPPPPLEMSQKTKKGGQNWDLVEVISMVKKNRKTQKLTDSIILSGFRKDLMGFRKKSLICYEGLLMDVRV